MNGLRRSAGAPPVRLVHLGLGNFFRAHQAWYTTNAPDAAQWGIAAFTGRSTERSHARAAESLPLANRLLSEAVRSILKAPRACRGRGSQADITVVSRRCDLSCWAKTGGGAATGRRRPGRGARALQ